MSSPACFRRSTLIAVAVAALLAWAWPAQARVTRIIVDQTVSPAFVSPNGLIQYETLTGRAFGELDPAHPLNAIINDIDLAPTNAAGKVEYVASFVLVKPMNMAQSSGLLWHDVPNRGGRIVLPQADLRNAGDVGLSSAWQGDNMGNGGAGLATTVPANADSLTPVPPSTNEWVKVPVLTGVTGQVFGRIVNRSGAGSQRIFVQSNLMPYRPSTLDTGQATLVSRTHESMEGAVTGEAPIPSTDWAWAKCPDWLNQTPLSPTDPAEICLKDGYDPLLLYQVVFTAKDPYVLGAGFAAWRDVAAFFRNEAEDDHGWENPVAGHIKWSISRGSSQSGNFLRGFLHLGFNQDEAGRQLHDGTWPIIAGRRVALNFRWAQPDGVLELYQAGSEGPQWWRRYQDHVRGLPARSILDRCTQTQTCPKVVEHFGSAEVWGLKLTPEWVGTDGKTDIALPPNVRRYYIASTTHGGSNAAPNFGFDVTFAANATCPGNNYNAGQPALLKVNPVRHTETVNAIRYHLRRWVMQGILPPDSVYPTIRPGTGKPPKAGTLSDPTKLAMGFPSLPPALLPPLVPESSVADPGGLFINPVLDYDWGPEFDPSDASGNPTNIPPPIKQVIRMLVPKVDADGNELGGVPVVLRDAPLGTYLGWNVSTTGFHKDQICNYVGGMIPFYRTQAEREAASDPRLSLEERYGNHAGYVAAVTAAADRAVAMGFLLPQDAATLIAAAAASNVLNP